MIAWRHFIYILFDSGLLMSQYRKIRRNQQRIITYLVGNGILKQQHLKQTRPYDNYTRHMHPHKWC